MARGKQTHYSLEEFHQLEAALAEEIVDDDRGDTVIDVALTAYPKTQHAPLLFDLMAERIEEIQAEAVDRRAQP